MPEAALSLGSNQGDSVAAFVFALRGLETRGAARLLALSAVYRTPPWGKTDQPDFLNVAARVAALCPPRALLDSCLALEAERGRVRREKWAPRTLDIDIVDYAGVRLQEAELILPHPHAQERAFVLVPLREIAPDLRLGAHTVAEWADLCDARGVARDDVASKALQRAFPHVAD